MKISIYLSLAFLIISSAVMGGLFFCISIPPLDFNTHEVGKGSLVLDDGGQLLCSFHVDKKEHVHFNQLPLPLVQAFIAAEDHTFFSHYGVCLKGIARSLYINIKHGALVQGASTITQQLVKLMMLDSKKTLGRKIKEQWYSLLLELYYSKEQIFEQYINNIYFGCGIYGVQAACKRFWGKEVENITIEQAATLAAIVKSPGHYCPLLFPLSAQQRRNVVLSQMHRLGFITTQEFDAGLAQLVNLVVPESQDTTIFIKEYVRKHVEPLVGKKKLYQGGLIIKTTFNKTMQESAHTIVDQKITQLRTRFKVPIDLGLVTLEVETGHIKVMIGGYKAQQGSFNRATQAYRQMGSIFKALIYAVALQKGLAFNDVMVDEPLDIAVPGSAAWHPKNANNSYEGALTLAQALMQSNNIVAIKVLLQIGFEPLMQLAQLCNIPIDQPYPSLALGCVDATPLQVAAMFNIFANNGVFIEPYAVEWVKDSTGQKIFEHRPVKRKVLDSLIVQKVSHILSHGLEKARRRSADWIASPAIGKTGTTNKSRNCWFAGATPDYCTTLYTGCDDNRSLGDNVFASMTSFPIWLALHKTFLPKKLQFVRDPHLKEQYINAYNGALTGSSHHSVGVLI